MNSIQQAVIDKSLASKNAPQMVDSLTLFAAHNGESLINVIIGGVITNGDAVSYTVLTATLRLAGKPVGILRLRCVNYLHG